MIGVRSRPGKRLADHGYAEGVFATRPELRGTFGMVSSTHWLASAAGMAMLERGGNAFDAAAAAGFVLQVVEPHLNGPGGEVPILAYSAAQGRVFVVGGQGPAPAAASIDRFRALGLDLVPGTGLLPACVPGAFGAWMLLLAEHGTLRPREVLGPAIGYAEGGFPALPGIGQAVAAVEELFRTEWPSSAEVWLGGGVPAPGRRLRNPALAATWRRLLAEAEAVSGDRGGQVEAALATFYEGFVAEAIAGYLATAEVMDVSGRRHRGLLDGDDLHGWRATTEAPATLDYHGWTVCKTGPWGQGPVFLQQLALLDGFDLAGMGLGGEALVHTVVECAKLAFADREAWYGDPEATDVPLDGLLDPAYAERRRALIGDAASLELRPGSPGGRAPRLPAAPGMAPAAAAGSGEPTLGPPAGDTCHVDVVDRHGNLVAATPSGGWLQSSPAVPGLGFCLTTRGQMFWLQEGLASSLRGGTRPRTTLSPTLALRDGEPCLAFGTPGGDGQDQWPLQFFLAHTEFGLDLQAAIDAPVVTSEHAPSSFWPRRAAPGLLRVEGRLDPAVVAGLRARGHLVEVGGPWSIGRTCVAGRDPASGLLLAAANPRGRQAYAVGR
jgi:gamma-glutamyltranspeptidase / glutathione hydrolase